MRHDNDKLIDLIKHIAMIAGGALFSVFCTVIALLICALVAQSVRDIFQVPAYYGVNGLQLDPVLILLLIIFPFLIIIGGIAQYMILSKSGLWEKDSAFLRILKFSIAVMIVFLLIALPIMFIENNARTDCLERCANLGDAGECSLYCSQYTFTVLLLILAFFGPHNLVALIIGKKIAHHFLKVA